MSHFLDHLSYLARERETYADGHGSVTREDRTREESYRQHVQRQPREMELFRFWFV